MTACELIRPCRSVTAATALALVQAVAWAAGPPAAAPAMMPTTLPADASGAARRALETLLGSLAEGETVEAAPAPAPARLRTTVQRGETLDALIRRTMMDVPLKEAALRAVFVELNPQAFPRGLTQRLPAGTALLIPSAADLRPHLARTLAQLQAQSESQAPGASRQAGAAAPVVGTAGSAPSAVTAAPRAGSGGSWATPVAAARASSAAPASSGQHPHDGPGNYPPASIVQNSAAVLFTPSAQPPGHSQVPWGPAWGPSRNAPAHQGWVRFP